MPRIDDTLDAVGGAKFFLKVDQLKGFHQVQFGKRAREVPAFITLDGLFEYTVMPFPMRNAGSTFQRLVNWVVNGLKGVRAYVNNLIIYLEKWEEHLSSFCALLEKPISTSATKSVTLSSLHSCTSTTEWEREA